LQSSTCATFRSPESAHMPEPALSQVGTDDVTPMMADPLMNCLRLK
jgi:hypothetical protein